MNNLQFKRHLKALVQGHHHPEEHDWTAEGGGAKPRAPSKSSATARRTARKSPKKK